MNKNVVALSKGNPKERLHKWALLLHFMVQKY